jgi:hypothetical protein
MAFGGGGELGGVVGSGLGGREGEGRAMCARRGVKRRKGRGWGASIARRARPPSSCAKGRALQASSARSARPRQGGGQWRARDLGNEALEHDEVEPGGGGAEGPVPVDKAVEAAAPEREGAELADGERRGLRPLLAVRLVAVPMVVVVAALPPAVGGVDERAQEGSANDVGALAGEE